MTITFASRSSSTWKQSLIASTMVAQPPKDPPQLGEVGARATRGGSTNACSKRSAGSAGGSASAASDPLAHELARPRLISSAVVRRAARAAEGSASNRPTHSCRFSSSTRSRSMYAFGSSAVACGAARYVTASMNVGPVAGPCALDRLARRLVDGEHVTAVDPHARHAVADGFVRERLGGRLRLERRRDRPLVVVAEEDERGLE